MGLTAAERQARYRQAHPDRIKAAHKAALVRDPDLHKRYGATYRALHPERVRASNAKYRAAHLEASRERVALWWAAHPEEDRAKQQRRRARIKAGTVEKFLDVEIFERDDWVCQICFDPIDPSLRGRHPMQASLDHITPISKGGNHTRNNVQAAHYRCNAGKGDR